jgi:hypothetical protein
MLLHSLRHNVQNNNMAESAHSSNNHRHRKRQIATVNGASVATRHRQLSRELGSMSVGSGAQGMMLGTQSYIKTHNLVRGLLRSYARN